MRTIVTRTKAYKLSELKPKARARALSDYQDMMDASGDTPWQQETFDSLKELFDAAGVKMRDWSLGADSYSYVRPEFPGDGGAADLTGPRALAWIENNLLAQFRAPFGLNKADGNLHCTGDNGKRGRHYRKTWRRYYVPGAVKSCPLTGYCADEDYIDDLIKSIKAGRTLKEAFADLADVYRKLIEGEIEYQRSPEAFKEWAYNEEFTHSGERI